MTDFDLNQSPDANTAPEAEEAPEAEPTLEERVAFLEDAVAVLTARLDRHGVK